MQHRWWLPAVSAALVVLLLGGLGVLLRPPWHDELFTLHVAHLDATAIIDALRVDSGPPGHYLMCRPLVAIGGDSVRWLRLPSLLAAALAAWIVVVTAGRRGTAVAWAAAALIATHPLVLAAAVEARAYALLLVLAAGAGWIIDDAVSRGRAIALAATLAAACWVHALGLVLAGAVAVVAIALATTERLRVWSAVLAGLAVHLPWLPIMAHQPPQSLAWMEGAIARAPEWKQWLLPLSQSSPAADHRPWLDLAGLPPVVEVLALAAWAWLLARGLGERRARRQAALWTVAAAALISVNLLLRPIYLPGRSEVLTLAMVVVVAAVGTGRARSGAAAAAALATCGLAITTMSLAGWARTPPGPDREIARVLGDLVHPGDTVVTTGWWWLGLRHALGERADQLEWRTFPADSALHPGWYDDDAAAAAARADASRLLLDPPHHRMWIVRTNGLASDRELDRVVTGLGLARAGGSSLWSLWGPPAADVRPPPGP